MLGERRSCYADEAEIRAAIEKRLSAASLADRKDLLALLLGEAIGTILKINESIPFNSPLRYLISEPLEEFANGGSQKAHTASR